MRNSLLLGMALIPSFLSADLNKDLNGFFNKFGSVANVNAADIYEGQKAGYATAGGLSVRNRVINNNLVRVDLPRFDAGCGGIDIYTGGFSFINSEQIAESFKAIGSSALGYSAMLALETASPQIASTITKLQSWANDINSSNINSCEIAAGAVGGVWPKSNVASQAICRSVGGKKGHFSDYAAAKHKCSQSGDFQKEMQHVKEDSQYKDVLLDEYNITWNALKKQEMVGANNEIRELFMSMIGSFVISKNETTEVLRLPSMIGNADFINALMNGGEVESYTCNELDKCLKPTKVKRALSAESSWTGLVKAKIMGIREKILSDEALNSDQIAFVGQSRIPIYRVINVMTAYKKDKSPVDLENIADMIAFDMMCDFLTEVIFVVREGALQLKGAQVVDDSINDLLEELSVLKSKVNTYRSKVADFASRENQLMSKIDLIEKKIFSEIIFQ